MRLIRFLRSLRGFWTLSILLWLIGAALCFFLIPLVTPQLEVIFIGIALVTAVWLLAVVLRQYHRIRAERSIAQLVELEVQRDAAQAEPDEYQILNDKLKHALSMQQSARTVNGSKIPLYELPWYLVIGMSAAGKTSLLNRSGLSASMAGGQQLNATVGTQYCDWYFSREAVMIDTAGRYLLEDHSASEFANFLKTLRKKRKKPAINGLVLVVDLPRLLEQSRQENHALARQLTSRVAEYRQSLGVNPPVYLFFSKTDLVPGFAASFEQLDAQQRQQPLGITFSMEEVRRTGIFEAFEGRFTELIAALRQGARQRINEAEPGAAVDIEALRFPDYFAELGYVIADFIDQFDLTRNADHSVVLRGLYFSSALQSGESLQPILDEEVSETFALSSEVPSSAHQSGSDKSYFITDTFREVIFRDRNLASYYSAHGDKRSAPMVLAGGALCLGVLAIAAQGWSAYNNHAWLNHMQSTVGALQNASETDQRPDQDNAYLNQLADYLATIEEHREDGVPLSLDMGLYQGDSVAPALKAAWASELKRSALTPIEGELRRQLEVLNEFVPRDQLTHDTPAQDAEKNAATPQQSPQEQVRKQAEGARQSANEAGNRALDAVKERATSRPTLSSVPTSASDVRSQVRSEISSRTTDNARNAWYSARGTAQTQLEEGINGQTSKLGQRAKDAVNGANNDDAAADGDSGGGSLLLSGEQGPSLSEEMLTRLNQSQVEQLIESYSALRLYLVLSNPSAHRDQAEFVAPALQRLWAQLGRDGGETLSEETIQRNVDLYIRYLRQGKAPALERDDELVDISRQQLNAFLIHNSFADREYLRYQLEVEERFKPVSLGSLVPEMKGHDFYSRATVPAFYTREVWDKYLRDAIIKSASGDISDASDWVLNEGQPSDAVQSRAQFVSRILKRYKQDYAVAWERFLGSLQISHFSTLDEASQRLGRLSDLQQSPLVKVLQAVQDNTNWDAPQHDDDSGSAKEDEDQSFWRRITSVFSGDGDGEDTGIDLQSLPRINDGALAKHFRPLTQLLAADDSSGSDDSLMNQYLLDLRQLKARVDNIRGAQDSGSASKAFIVDTLAGEPNEINQLRNLIDSRVDTSSAALVSALTPLFRAPVEDSWKALNGPARSQLNAAWNQDVSAPWHKMIAGRYPVAESVNEASVRDLRHFLDPQQGVLSQFRDEQIGELSDEATGQRSDMVDSRMLATIDNAIALGQVLDSLSNLDNGFELQIRPVTGLTDIILSIDGQQIHYRNTAPEWKRMVWPAKSGSSGARMDVIDSNGERHTVFDYPSRWGFLRMIDSARISSLDNSRQRFTWETPMGSVGFDVRNFGGVSLSDLQRIKSLSIPTMGG